MRTAPINSSAAHQGRPEPPTDAALLGGTRVDFAAVFDRHAAEIYRYCARRVGADAADDAVADTFAIAYEKRGRFDGSRSSALPWLYGIATNVLRRYRAADARRNQPIRDDGAVHSDGMADLAVARADADAVVRALADDLAKLPRRHREVLYLFAAGLTYADIATALGIPIGTVMSRLHRARTRLRSALLALGIDHNTLEGLA